MSEKKNVLIEKMEQLKAAFNKIASDVATPVEVVTENFATVKTADGVELNIEGELVVGSKVTMKDTSGQLVPAPEGAVTLEDGTIIVVMGGVISEVNPPAQADAAAPVEQAAEDFNTKFNSINETLSSLVARIEGIEKSIAGQSFAKADEFEAIKDVVNKTYAVVEGLVNTPAASVENKFSSDKRKDKINELRNLLNN